MKPLFQSSLKADSLILITGTGKESFDNVSKAIDYAILVELDKQSPQKLNEVARNIDKPVREVIERANKLRDDGFIRNLRA